jgi:hypothetical protein
MMREAESWLSVVDACAHLGAQGELERQIKRIQADALHEAKIIADAAKVPSGTKDWNEGFWNAQKQISGRLTELISSLNHETHP